MISRIDDWILIFFLLPPLSDSGRRCRGGAVQARSRESTETCLGRVWVTNSELFLILPRGYSCRGSKYTRHDNHSIYNARSRVKWNNRRSYTTLDWIVNSASNIGKRVILLDFAGGILMYSYNMCVYPNSAARQLIFRVGQSAKRRRYNWTGKRAAGEPRIYMYAE